MPLTRWWAERAWLDDHVVPDVLLEADAGRFVTVRPGVPPPAGIPRLPGLVLPGFANTHSHAFHRALRGRTSADGGDFWSWRQAMYAVAERLDPDSYRVLARAAYAEMALAGYTCVGEFHYLHHAPGGTPYADPHAMSGALATAATEAGVRLTLLDTCYLAGGIGGSLIGVQRRFGDGDGDVDRWAARAADFTPSGQVRVGCAIHSVRAVPPAAMPTVVGWAAARDAPLHVHVSEQPAENDACRAAYGVTPTRLLADAGALGRRTAAVHATHLTSGDVALLADTGTGVCACPTTERDLADGIGPLHELAAAGVALSLGSDSHAVVDPFEEARALELDERLRSGRRGCWTPAELIRAGTAAGHCALGWPDGGRLAVGAHADLVVVGLDSVRLAGVAPEQVVVAATAADVRQVVVDGRDVVRDGRHVLVEDVPAALAAAVAAVLS